MFTGALFLFILFFFSIGHSEDFWICTLNIGSVPVSFSVSELEASVKKLQKEAEQLKEQRNQQKQLADSSARQRDMYKALLTQSTGFSLPPQGDTRILKNCVWAFLLD